MSTHVSKPRLKTVEEATGNQKLELEYPCSWCYKVVGTEREKLEKAIREVMAERSHELKHSKTSSGGKYISLNLDLLVHSDEDRQFIYDALKKHDDVKMVL